MKSAAGNAAVSGRPARSVVVGTAGHIDHGKTSLVYALTGTDTDRLPEEKQRGITIDLGFAAIDLEGPQGELHLSLIDVPGHHAFIRNMLAGTGGIDLVMLVIAADEGVMAQTEEHLAICTLLGIEHGLVALTKADAVDEEQLARTRDKVAAFLKDTFLQGAPLIAVSARTGAGISQLRDALAEVAAAVPKRSSEWVPRLPLDRSFSVRGFGTVVTGTLQSGEFCAGETLEQYPAGRQVRVRGVQVHGANCDRAQAPCRTALNLAGIEVAQVGRGDTLAPPGMLVPTHTIDVELTMLRNTPALKHGSRVRVHGFTADSIAKILLFGDKENPGTGSSLARLKLDKPMLLVPGDRLVLRQCSPAITIGGARVLDTTPLPRIRKAITVKWLQALRSADDEEQLRLRGERRDMNGISLAELTRETGRTADALRTSIRSLVAGGHFVGCGAHESTGHWITVDALGRAMRRAEEEVLRAGPLSRAELRSRTALNPVVFEVGLQRLIAARTLEISGETVRESGSGDQIPERTRQQLHAIETAYANAGLAAPLLSDLTRELRISQTEMRELVTRLLRSKRLVRMGADNALVHSSALEKLYGDLRNYRGQTFDVGRFKSLTGLTRKHAIPLLEHLDSVRVTRNDNGTRVVL